MATIPTDRHALIMFVAWYSSSKLGRPVSRIRLMKFLYLADVHFYAQRRRLATGYRWKFYHYGPYAAEAQNDIDECVNLGLLGCDVLQRADDAGDVSLYRAYGTDPAIHERFSATLDTVLACEIQRWVGAELNTFLDYVYFDTAPMREARRGEYLRFDETTFPVDVVREPAAERPKKYASRETRKAYQRFLESRRAEKAKVPVPRDAIVDEAFDEAVRLLDAQDALAGPLEGSVEVDPDALT
jgi:hypothetical protein